MPFDCLGLSILGDCNYNPSDHGLSYFSIGEAIAALSVTLAIPQILKPIYRFRLDCSRFSLKLIYISVFIGAGCVLVAGLLPNFVAENTSPFAFPIVWEIFGAAFFTTAFLRLAVATTLPAKVRPSNIIKFAKLTAEFLAEADEQRRVDMATDLADNFAILVELSSVARHSDTLNAFEEFVFRHEIEKAQYASALLEILSDPDYCRTLVQQSPWVVVRTLRGIESAGSRAHACKPFVRELARQTIIAPNSMMSREIEFGGFSVAPLLSSALFQSHNLNRNLEPLSGLWLFRLERIDAPILRRLKTASRWALKTILDNQEYWMDQNFRSLLSEYESVFRSINTMADKDKTYEIHHEVQDAVCDLIELATLHFQDLPPERRSTLYQQHAESRDYHAIQCLSELVYNYLENAASSFDGYLGENWLYVHDVMTTLYPRFGETQVGMNPLQQRVAIKIITGLKKNIEHGYYPPITKIVIGTMSPYEATPPEQPRTAYRILSEACFHELRALGKLQREDPTNFHNFLPKTSIYLVATNELVQVFSGGQKAYMQLDLIAPEPVSMSLDQVGYPPPTPPSPDS
jgi:hypothetical protein